MKSQAEIAQAFRDAIAHRKITQAELRGEAGISQRTLTHVLSGHADYKLSTFLALCDRLGLEPVLVPKGAAPAVAAGGTTEPAVTTRVQGALSRVGAETARGAKQRVSAPGRGGPRR